MAGPVIVGALVVPAIGFLVRFYAAVSRDRLQRSVYRVDDLEQFAHADLASGEVPQRRISLS